ncbi:MAG TPA: FAD-binding oxidoreductase, partial [Acidimicrobiia bacterium]|nr:FAD-binding oxidoreductase [Acidimicrobiia bacterium]
MAGRRRSFWGWGYEDEGLTAEQRDRLGHALAERFALDDVHAVEPPALDELSLRPPRVVPPEALHEICSTDAYDRAGHTYGKSFRDVVRALARDFDVAPDLV